ncbi:Cytochrome P450 [Aphelenchoides fujianensis]|nr:Cytochrome P450 [Aphelenchoides fujianensis]
MFVQQGDAFVDRGMPESALKLTRGGPFGIVFNSGDLWREQRRFALSTLRNFGLGKNQMQERILDEVRYLIDRLDEEIASQTEEINVIKHTDLTVGSVLNSVLCGYRFTTNNREHEFVDIKEKTVNFFASLGDPLFQISMNYKILLHIPWFQRNFDRKMWPQREIFRFIERIIDEHERSTDYEEEFEPRDFIDAYMLEQTKKERSGEAHGFSRKQLSGVLVDTW